MEERVSWSDGLDPVSPAYALASSANRRVRVVAGPGTGKSFAMKRRVARLLDAGVAPRGILPVTFTRVAAEDLHRELVSMSVPGSYRVAIGAGLLPSGTGQYERAGIRRIGGRYTSQLGAADARCPNSLNRDSGTRDERLFDEIAVIGPGAPPERSNCIPLYSCRPPSPCRR